jgi:branched-chain amino acid transport system substrate-binding protein
MILKKNRFQLETVFFITKGVKTMKKLTKLIAAVTITLFVGFAFATLGFAEVRVGVISSQTSGLAILGQRQINSAILATEEWNARGGINGQKIKLVIEDSADKTTTAVTALDRVLGKKVCAILGPIYSFQLFAMFPEIKKENVPMLTTSGTRKLTQMDNPWYFRTYPHDGITKRASTLYSIEELKSKRPALMCVTTEYGKSGHELITNILNTKGIATVAETWHEKADKDLTGQLLKIKRAEPDIIISQAHPSDTAILLKQQHDLGINVPHMASSAASMPSVHKLVGTAMEGIYVEAAALPNFDPDPNIQVWTKKYVAKFKTQPDSFAILYYDTANFLFEAIKAVGPHRTKIRNWLEKNTYKGLAGQYKFDEEHNGAYFAIIVQYHMEDGKAVPELKKKYDFTPK